MSWAVTFNDFADRPAPALPAETEEYIASQHPLYLSDMLMAWDFAKALGFAAVTLTGMRTINPYGDDEVVDVSVRGTMKQRDFFEAVKRDLRAGPDSETPETPD